MKKRRTPAGDSLPPSYNLSEHDRRNLDLANALIFIKLKRSDILGSLGTNDQLEAYFEIITKRHESDVYICWSEQWKAEQNISDSNNYVSKIPN